MAARRVRRHGLHRAGARDRRSPRAGRAPPRPRWRCAASALLRPLRRATGRSAGTLDQRPLRAGAAGGPARSPHPRPRRGGRQGPGDDVGGGAARLARRRRRPAGRRHRADRGRGGGRQRQSRSLPRRQPRPAARRCRGDQRHRHVGHRHAGDHHQPARPGLCADRRAGGGAGPAFRHVWWQRAEPDQPADQPSRRDPRRRWPRGAARLLRRRGGGAGGAGRAMGNARLRRGGVPPRNRPLGARRRGRARRAGAALGAAHLRHQRHLGRLHGRGEQDRHPRQGARETLLPPGSRPGSGAHRAIPARLRRRPLPGRCHGDRHHPRHGAGDGGRARQPRHRRRARGAGGGIRPSRRARRRRRLHPGGGEPAAPAGARLRC